MSSVCHSHAFVCHSYVLVYHSYVTRVYSYVIHMSLVCHPYVTCMYLYVIRMLLVCTRMSSVCHSCGFTMNPLPASPESFHFVLGPSKWNKLPGSTKKLSNINTFKYNLKKLSGTTCNCYYYC